VAGLWSQVKEQMIYLLKGPGAASPFSLPVVVPPPIPPLKTNLAFESHILTEAAGKLPQHISSAWDERRRWGEQNPLIWQGLTAQDRKRILLDIYLNNPWVSACIDVIAKRIFSGGYVVEKIDEEAKDNQQHFDVLNEFLLRINPDWDFNQLGRSLVQDKLIFGECYSELTWKNGQPWQLFKIDAIPMGYIADRYGQIEQFYQELEWSRQRNYLDPQNIIRWWFPHPRSSIDPFAPAEKVSDAVVIDKKMMTWMTSFFQKGAKFSYYFKGVADRDEADRFLVWFRQNFTGEKNAHVPPVTWGNAEIAPLGNAGALEMDFQKGLDRMRTIVFAAFGVPPAAVSIIESGNIGGGTGEDQDKSLIFNACDPVKQAFLEKLNDRIVKRGFGITDYRIGLKYADYRSDESVAKVEDLRIKNGSRTVDEIRLESGKKPYKHGGGVPFIWSSKEVVPLSRLEDLEDEQRQTAQIALATAQANADLAQTKAKQAKEPAAPVPPALQQSGQLNNALLQKRQQSVPQKETDEPEKKQREQESQEAVKPIYFTGKTELPQWTDPDMAERLAQFKEQGVYALTWKVDGNPCATCLMNDGVTVKLGMPFPSGHALPQVHPNCACEVLAIHGIDQTQEDKDATQKLPVVRKKQQKVELTENDLWDGRM